MLVSLLYLCVFVTLLCWGMVMMRVYYPAIIYYCILKVRVYFIFRTAIYSKNKRKSNKARIILKTLWDNRPESSPQFHKEWNSILTQIVEIADSIEEQEYAESKD